MKATIRLPVSLVGEYCITVNVPENATEDQIQKAHSRELSRVWIDVVTRAVIGKAADGVWFEGTMGAGGKEFAIGVKEKPEK